MDARAQIIVTYLVMCLSRTLQAGPPPVPSRCHPGKRPVPSRYHPGNAFSEVFGGAGMGFLAKIRHFLPISGKYFLEIIFCQFPQQISVDRLSIS